ncbi:MAG TPA: FMN-binding protein [Bacillota bacterium]|nr:FMN-binding protein [Bacillota bacterium]
MRDIIKLSLILALICAVAGASLAATHSVTSKIVEERRGEELVAALGELLPDADAFELVVEEDGATYYLGTKLGQPVGAVMLAAGQGYGGPVNVLVSIDMDGEVRTVQVTDHKETAGIGDKVETPDFLSQYIGKTASDSVTVGQDITAVSGATVTSRAVAAGVRNALADHQVYLLGMTAPTDDFDLSKVKDGVYQGTSTEGYKDRIDVEVTVEGGRIILVEVTYQNDTAGLAEYAVEDVTALIVAKQHWQVDATSGATFTSNAIMEAVRNAIPDTTLRIENIIDGTYEGEGEGYKSTIKVAVTVAGGKITAIDILEQDESPYASDPAFDEMPDLIISEQSVEVDAISTATFTSIGIIEAVTNALENAPRN